MATAPPLVVVDLQRVVTPGNGWAIDGVTSVIDRAAELAAAHVGPVLATRHRLAADGPGRWRVFAEQWDHLDDGSTAFELVRELAHLEAVDKTTYSAYSADPVREAARRAGHLVICGVETDCCIAATVMAAVDDGVMVTVVRDAVLGPDPVAHEGALRAFGRLPLQVRLVSTAQVLAEGPTARPA